MRFTERSASLDEFFYTASSEWYAAPLPSCGADRWNLECEEQSIDRLCLKAKRKKISESVPNNSTQGSRPLDLR